MSDFPNGTPPGQNNLDAGVERYVPLENDTSAATQRNIDEQKEPDPEVEEELATASKNFVQPSAAEEKEEPQEEAPKTGTRTPAPAGNNPNSKK